MIRILPRPPHSRTHPSMYALSYKCIENSRPPFPSPASVVIILMRTPQRPNQQPERVIHTRAGASFGVGVHSYSSYPSYTIGVFFCHLDVSHNSKCSVSCTLSTLEHVAARFTTLADKQDILHEQWKKKIIQNHNAWIIIINACFRFKLIYLHIIIMFYNTRIQCVRTYIQLLTRQYYTYTCFKTHNL